MEIQGLTPIDTLYEYAGHSIGFRLSEYMIWNGYFVGLVVVGALLRLYYVGSRKGSYTDMAVYPLYVLVIALLLWPVEVSVSAPGSETYVDDGKGWHLSGRQGIFWYPDFTTIEQQQALAKPHTVRVPRVLAYVSAIVDALQHALVHDVDRNLFDATFRWLNVAAINQNSRILDLDLRRDFGLYLSYCYWPAIAEHRSEDADPWQSVPLAGLSVDEWLAGLYDKFPHNFVVIGRTTSYPDRPSLPCRELHLRLRAAIADHVARAPFHANAIATYAKLAEKEGNSSLGREAYEKFYLRRLVYNETFVVGQSELASVRHAIPEYSLMKDGTWNLTYMSVPNATAAQSDSLWTRINGAFENLPSIIASIFASFSEWWSQRTLGAATYYRVSSLGPWVYGLVTAFLLMLFPLAGLMAFWPGWWTAILNFMKVFLSVKLWPVLWSFISGMISYRAQFNPEDPNGLETAFGYEGMLPALAGMYLLTPVISYMIVSIASHAGALAMGPLVGPGSTGSPAMAVGTLAAAGHAGGAVVTAAARRTPGANQECAQ